jgi:hypothetical protein
VVMRQLQCCSESRRAATNDQNRVILCAHDIMQLAPLAPAPPR